MSSDNISLNDQLAQLRKGYVAQLPKKVAELRDAYAIAFASSVDQDALFKLYRLAHSLAGSGAIYGFQVIGDKARQLEQVVKPYAEQAKQPESEVATLAARHLDDLEVLVRQTSVEPV